MTTSPSPSQAAVIAYFHDGTRSTVRSNQTSYAVCRREGWIAEIERFPFHRATDDGVRAIGLEPPVHLHTGFGVDGKATCDEQVTEQTRTATSIDKVTCTSCVAAYNAYAASLTGELHKFANREAPYDQEPAADPAEDARLRQQLGMDEADEAAVADDLGMAGETQATTDTDQSDAPEEDPATWRMPTPMRLVDVAETARQMFGDGAAALFPGLPEHDYRFEAALPSGARVTFASGATADEVAAYLQREGVDLDGGERRPTGPTAEASPTT